MQNFDSLIDHAAIAEASQKLDALHSRRGPATAAVTAAETELLAARAAYSEALLTGDATAAKAAVDVAIQRLVVARDVPPAVESGIRRAETTLRDVRSRAMAPAMGAAIQARLASARRADAAREELAAAREDQKSANAAIRQFGGSFHWLETSSASLTPPSGDYQQPTLKEDIVMFAAPHGYFPGLDEAGNVKS